jgi:hypothetical protein
MWVFILPEIAVKTVMSRMILVNGDIFQSKCRTRMEISMKEL